MQHKADNPNWTDLRRDIWPSYVCGRQAHKAGVAAVQEAQPSCSKPQPAGRILQADLRQSRNERRILSQHLVHCSCKLGRDQQLLDLLTCRTLRHCTRMIGAQVEHDDPTCTSEVFRGRQECEQCRTHMQF